MEGFESVDKVTITNSYATDQSYYGNTSLKLNVSGVEEDGRARYYEDFTSSELIPGSTYTLSSYVKTSGITGTDSGKYGATLIVNSFDNDGTTILTEYSEYITGTTTKTINDGWKRLRVTFTVPTEATQIKINLALENQLVLLGLT